MGKNFSQLASLVLKNKQVFLGAVVLCLAIVFIFSLRGQGRAENAEIISTDDDFVVKSQENSIQPVETAAEEESVQTDAIIYDSSMKDRVACENNRAAVGTIASLPAGKIRMPILTYHYIEVHGTTTLPWLYHSPAVFEAQLKTLADNCYQSFFVSEVAAALEGKAALAWKPVAITFDDGYADMYTEAYPLLKKYKMKGTMYIIVNALDKPGYLTREQVKEMAASGYVEIASHTLNHANLNNSSWAVARYELLASKEALEKILARPVASLAYPYGFFTIRDEKLCQQAGYSACVSTYPGQVQDYDGRYSLYRLRPGYRVGPSLLNWLDQAGPKN